MKRVVFRHLEQEELDAHHSPSRFVDNAGAIMQEWLADSEYLHTTYPQYIQKNRQYGEHERQILDIWPPKVGGKLCVFIHGGFWQMLSKEYAFFAAKQWADSGYGYCAINYRLCPEFTLNDIISDITLALQYLEKLGYGADDIILAGHSAGAYLAALFPAHRHILIGGVYDLLPVCHSVRNEKIGLTPVMAEQLTITAPPPSGGIKILVGANETPQFIAQSDYFAGLCTNIGHELIKMPNMNHFNIVRPALNPNLPNLLVK